MAAPKLKLGAGSSAQVKKISPYPIEVQITKGEGQPPMKGQIVKIQEIGFLMKVDTSHYYKVADVYHFQFEFPVIHKTIRAQGIVVKTYETMEVSGKDQVRTRTIEIHFKNLPETDRIHLNTYLVKSGQRK